MNILPSNLICRYITAVELDGKPIIPTFIDMETGRVQYWEAGKQVEAAGKVRILLEGKDANASLDPVRANELDKLLEQIKQKMASMETDNMIAAYQECKDWLSLFVSAEAPNKDYDLGLPR